jgi:hypothetical protein
MRRVVVFLAVVTVFVCAEDGVVQFPCGCEHCIFIEREYLVDVAWTRREISDCICNYTIQGLRRPEYKETFSRRCDDWWFKDNYCKLPLPPYGYMDAGQTKIGVEGKTRLGYLVRGSGLCSPDGICAAVLRFVWQDAVFEC